MRERSGRLRTSTVKNVLRLKDDRLPKTVLFGHPSRGKQEEDRPGRGEKS